MINSYIKPQQTFEIIMGYTTNFSGKFSIYPKLNPSQIDYLNAFSNTRHMARDSSIAEKMPDSKRIAVGLPIGVDGEYFVGSLSFCGQDNDKSVMRYNDPASTQPGLWCQWVPSSDGKYLQWDGSEKFYKYEEWVKYIIDHFLKPWGCSLNGDVKWRGDETDDRGVLIVKNNFVNSFFGESYKKYISEKKEIKKAKKSNQEITDEILIITSSKPVVKVKNKSKKM